MKLISLKIDGLTDLLSDLNEAVDKIKRPFKSIENSISDISLKDINDRTPVSSGTLKSNNKSTSSEDEIKLQNDTSYAVPVNDRKEFFYLDESTEEIIVEETIDNIMEELE